MGIPVILGLIGIFVLPPDPYDVQRAKKKKAAQTLSVESQMAGEPTESTPLTTTTVSSSSKATTDTEMGSGDTTVENSTTTTLTLKEQSITQQLFTPQFITQTFFFCWGMLHQNFYLGTIGDQIYMFAGNTYETLRSMAAQILTKLSIFYPLGCLLAIVPVGSLVRSCSVGISLYVYCTANLLFSILSLIPSVDLQWFTAGMYVIVRVGFFTVMSTYSSTIFGFRNLGTMFGCAGSVAGMVSLLGTFMSAHALNVDHSFLPINSILLVGAMINFAFPTVIIVQKWQQP